MITFHDPIIHSPQPLITLLRKLDCLLQEIYAPYYEDTASGEAVRSTVKSLGSSAQLLVLNPNSATSQLCALWRITSSRMSPFFHPQNGATKNTDLVNFLFSLRPHPWHMKVPGLGVRQECSGGLHRSHGNTKSEQHL